MRRRQFLSGLAVGIGALGLTLLYGWWQVDGPGAPEPNALRPLPLTAMNFRLSDHQGNAVGAESLAGRATMVFFGFTYCADICPTTLADIASWLDAIDEVANQINVVFITVDPERDNVDALAEYISYFHPAIRGWTGTPEQVARAAKGFGVTYEKVPSENGDYTMNHTSSVFLFNALGNFVTTIDYHEPRETAVPKILRATEG